MAASAQSTELKPTLGPWMLWGLGVGYVISGMYFGWNLGLPQGGPLGLLIATALVTAMYVAFVSSYAELSCSIPKAGGAFVYAHEGLGSGLGFLAGAAQCVEFVFAPPAIAAAIGAYFNLFFPQIPVLAVAFAAYFVFTALNIWGVKQSAVFELVITTFAVIELLVFAGATLPHFSWAEFTRDALPNGWGGIRPAIPYAIWFYLGIEGIANIAEETANPQRDLARGFGRAMFTLVVLAGLTFFGAVGVGGWQSVVFRPGTSETSDSPLPMALRQIFGEGHVMYHLLITIGICGLLASFHGLILAAGRATFEFGRIGYAPRILGHTLPGRKTPAAALILNMLFGFAALLTGRTSEIITISVFGALTLYAVSMLAFFGLRRARPDLPRPYRAPGYPWSPAVALALSLLCLGAMAYDNPVIGGIYVGLLGIGYAWFYLAVPAAVRRRRHLAVGTGLGSIVSPAGEPG